MGCNAMVAIEDDRLSPADATLTDRRRPGRTDYENANLIALLRDPSLITNPATTEVDAAAPQALSVDDLAPARGILTGLLVGVAMWAAIVVALWYFL
jgi:hypothetical protein